MKIITLLLTLLASSAWAADLKTFSTPPGQRYVVNGSTTPISSPLVVKSTTTAANSTIFAALTNAGGTALRVLQSGFVGIGKTPSVALDVLTGANLTALKTSDGVVTTTIYNGALGSVPKAGAIGTDTAHPLCFYTGAGACRALLSVLGNFGIGAVVPSTTLHVVGGVQVSSASYSAPTYGAGLELRYANDTLTGAPASYLFSFDRSNSAYKPMFMEASDYGISVGGARAITINNARLVSLYDMTINGGSVSTFNANFSSMVVTGTNGANTFVSNTGECATSTTTITTAGGDLRVTFSGAAMSGTANTAVGVGFLVDSAYVLGQTSTTGITRAVSPVTNIAGNVSFTRRVRGLAAGAHSVCIFFRAPSASGSVLSGDVAVLELEEIK